MDIYYTECKPKNKKKGVTWERRYTVVMVTSQKNFFFSFKTTIQPKRSTGEGGFNRLTSLALHIPNVEAVAPYLHPSAPAGNAWSPPWFCCWPLFLSAQTTTPTSLSVRRVITCLRKRFNRQCELPRALQPWSTSQCTNLYTYKPFLL